MNLSKPFIERPVMTTLVMIAIVFFGVLSYIRLPVSDLPAAEYPVLVVTAGLPGANPDTMANSVATPLEKAFMSIEGLSMMTSQNTLGQTQIVLQFTMDTDLNGAASDVNGAISGALTQLPQNLPANPTYQRVNPADAPILYLRLSSYTAPLGELYDWGNTYIGERISLVPGVAQVQVYGTPYSPRIQLDPQLVAARGQDFATLAQTVMSANVYQPIGNIDGQQEFFLFADDGQLMNGDGYNQIVYKAQDGTFARLSELGNTIDSVQNNKQLSYFVDRDTQEMCVVLAIRRQAGANTVAINKAINDLMPSLQAQLPGNISLKTIFDRSAVINESVHDVIFTLFLSIILVVAVIFIYLGRVTDTLIPSVVLPVTIVATFAVMYLFNYSIDTLSLMALSLSIGFVVDDAIVVLENIVRHTEMGKTPLQAALDGSKQISTTVFTMTLALSIVFIPILFLPGMLGALFHEFAVTIAVAILISGAIALTLTPMLCAKLVAKADKVSRLSAFSERLNHKLISIYDPLLTKVLDWPKTTLLGGLSCLALTVLCFHLMSSTFSTDDDMGFIIAATQSSQSISSASNTAHQMSLNKIFLANPNVQDVVAVTSTTSNAGTSFVRLKPFGTRQNIDVVMKELYPLVTQVPGINVFMRPLPLLNLDSGTGSNADFQYALTSLSTADLYQAASDITAALQQTPGFINVNNNMLINTPELKMTIQREHASILGISAKDIENALMLAYSTGKITEIDAPINQYYVIMEILPIYQQDPSNLDLIQIKNTKNGGLTYLKDLIDIQRIAGPSQVNHINQLPAVTIAFSLRPELPLSQALQTIGEKIRELAPKSVSGQSIGTAAEFEAMMFGLLVLVFVTVFMIYILLGVLYESYIFPLTVLSALPVAVLGGVVTLLLFGEMLSLFAMVGFFLLIGIVQKNGIMMIDYALDIMKEENAPAHDAIHKACMIRFRPIMMTTLAAIMGALPIAIGFGSSASSRRPLGLVVVGGLMFSQLLTLFLTPVVFICLERLRRKKA